MWDLLEGGHLFFARKNGILDDEQHLAEMVSLLGPPPPEFLTRSKKCYQYWDSQGTTPKTVLFYLEMIALFELFADVTSGNWKGSVPIPNQSFEIREQWLDQEDRTLFLQFLRRILCWMPEERPVAGELAFDDFLMQPQLVTLMGESSEKLT